MAPLHTNSYFALGKTHTVCQDYANNFTSEHGAMILAVSDGCSSSPDTDFGARFMVQAAMTEPNIKPEGLNFVTLDSGICVSMTEDETLELFPNLKGVNKSRVVTDPGLSGDMRLFKKAGKIVFTRENKLYSLSLK